jgi:hypothetical protein
LPIVLAARLLAVVVLTIAVSSEELTLQSAIASNTCALAQVAFCDTFSGRFAGGRSGDLDPTRWSVTRQVAGTNWGPSTLPICDQNAGPIVPDNDVKVCPPDAHGSYFDEQFDDHGGFLRLGFRPRQAFDFTGRTGKIVFDADAKTEGGHSWWVEVWITDQPAASMGDGPGVATFPRNGIGLEFSGCGAENPGQNLGGLQYINLIRNYSQNPLHYGGDFPAACYTTADGQRNHFEIRLSQNSVELWATDANGANFRQITSLSGINLPFTRGYVEFTHTQYNANKGGGGTSQQHFEWANMGFDGPVIPARGYDIPEPGIKNPDGSVHLAYTLPPGAQPGSPKWVLHNVDLTGVAEALLNLDVQSDFSSASGLAYRLNGGAWHTVASPFPTTLGDWRALSVPILLTELKPGDNTLELSSLHGLDVMNVDVTLNTTVTTTPSANQPTSTPQPPASTPTPAPDDQSPVPPNAPEDETINPAPSEQPTSPDDSASVDEDSQASAG